MAVVELILLQRVEKLGQMGDVVKVKPGYARNFLLPQKKALRANKANRATLKPSGRSSKRRTSSAARKPSACPSGWPACRSSSSARPAKAAACTALSRPATSPKAARTPA